MINKQREATGRFVVTACCNVYVSALTGARGGIEREDGSKEEGTNDASKRRHGATLRQNRTEQSRGEGGEEMSKEQTGGLLFFPSAAPFLSHSHTSTPLAVNHCYTLSFLGAALCHAHRLHTLSAVGSRPERDKKRAAAT